MKLETHGLTLLPLTHRRLLLYLDADGRLEEELGLIDSGRSVPSELVAALRESIVPAVADANNDYRFFTLWTAIDRNSRELVGDLCFKGMPDKRGTIEIGYGTYEAFQGKGYMTEAVGIITRWAFRRQGVKAVIAETDVNNIASRRVLEKNGFVRYETVDTIMTWWKLDNVANFEKKRE